MTNSILAYLDAGSISVAIQGILAGIAAIFVGIKVFGRRILSAFRPSRRKAEDDTAVTSHSTSTD